MLGITCEPTLNRAEPSLSECGMQLRKRHTQRRQTKLDCQKNHESEGRMFSPLTADHRTAASPNPCSHNRGQKAQPSSYRARGTNSTTATPSYTPNSRASCVAEAVFMSHWSVG